MSSSIVAGHSIDIATDLATIPTFTLDADHSLIGTLCPSPTCEITVVGSGNLMGVDPMLAPLANNGGPDANARAARWAARRSMRAAIRFR